MGGGAVTFVLAIACIGSLYFFLMFSKKPRAIPLIPSIFGGVHKMGVSRMRPISIWKHWVYKEYVSGNKVY